MGELRVGLSGWSYPEWRGGFYPVGLIQRRELEYASQRYNSIEINGTFYSLQSPKSFRSWHDATPSDFVFAVKGSKFITHQKRLKDVRIPLANFFASGLFILGQKLGPILWQFAPWYRFDPQELGKFLELLPRTVGEAAELTADHTIKSESRAWTSVITDVKLRYAFEPRHESFYTAEFLDLLTEHHAALAFADTGGKFGDWENTTADFVYLRLHGKDKLYESDYSEADLDAWADRIAVWRDGGQPHDARLIGGRKEKGGKRDVYVYFDNTMSGHAPVDAAYLANRLGVKKNAPPRDGAST